MIRQVLKLAVEAAKVELRRLFDDIDEADAEEAPPIVAAPVQVTAASAKVTPERSKWCSSAYHMKALGSPTCLECGAEKKVGAYMCKACADAARKAVAS